MAYGFLPHSLCSGTVLTTIVLGDCSDHSCARDCLDRPHARGLSQLRLFSGICHFPQATLGDCPDHSSTIAWGLLSSATCDLYSHTVERHLFRPCYKAHISPFSKLGDYVGTMHLPVHLVSRLYDGWILNLTGNSF